MIGRAETERLAAKIEARDKVDAAEAMRRAEAWAAKKNGVALPACTFPKRDCACGSIRCVEIKKPGPARDPKICVRPSLCWCIDCNPPRMARSAGKYETHGGR